MFNSLMLSAKAAGLFTHVSESNDNNMAARSVLTSLGSGSLLQQLSSMPFHGERLLNMFDFNNQKGW